MTELKQDEFVVVDDVSKAYGDNVVLENIKLKMSRGELCTVVGPSGCGKSTLLRLILGQESPDTGNVMVDGDEVTTPSSERGIVFQRYSLFPHLTVLENVMVGSQLSVGFFEAFQKRKQYADAAMQYLEYVHLAEHSRKYPHELSGGMRQRVAIAQALIKKPKILMMDEPFGALDPGTREAMQVLILSLWSEHRMTVFFVTHDLEEAVYLGTRILVLSQFYQGARLDQPRNCWGARIVADYPLQREAQSTLVKTSEKFGHLIDTIRHEGFDPGNLQEIDEFNLQHSSSVL